MNKGVNLASGEYIFFLNMGDVFFSEDVLSYIAKRMTDKKDVYYGDVQKDAQIFQIVIVRMESMLCHLRKNIARAVNLELLAATDAP